MKLTKQFIYNTLFRRLKVADQKLTEVDDMLYGDKKKTVDLDHVWQLVRTTGLIIDELIDAIEPYAEIYGDD